MDIITALRATIEAIKAWANSELGNKVDKVENKQLTDQNYSLEDKTKVDNMATGLAFVDDKLYLQNDDGIIEDSAVILSLQTEDLYVQNEEPVDADDGSIWIDLDEYPGETEVKIDADTLDGKHASDFVLVSNVNELVANKSNIDHTHSLDSLGAVSMKALKVTLATASWSNNTQTVSVDGVISDEANCHVFVTYAPESYTAYQYCGIRCSSQGDGMLTFACDNTPAADIAVNVSIFV